jgi:predicted naringenin-chalcone synthase
MIDQMRDSIQSVVYVARILYLDIGFPRLLQWDGCRGGANGVGSLSEILHTSSNGENSRVVSFSLCKLNKYTVCYPEVNAVYLGRSMDAGEGVCLTGTALS